MNKAEKAAIWTVVGVGACEAYRLLATPEQKRRWEGFVRTHHGEAGVALVAIGLALKSPALVGIGTGLALHDIDDAAEWFGD